MIPSRGLPLFAVGDPPRPPHEMPNFRDGEMHLLRRRGLAGSSGIKIHNYQMISNYTFLRIGNVTVRLSPKISKPDQSRRMHSWRRRRPESRRGWIKLSEKFAGITTTQQETETDQQPLDPIHHRAPSADPAFGTSREIPRCFCGFGFYRP